MKIYATFFIWTLLIVSIFSCQKESTSSHELDGTYRGKLITTNTTLEEGVLIRTSADTTVIAVKIADLSFERPESNKNCEGQVVWDNDKISFLSSDCSCWCDCNPAVDCAGDEILGISDGEMSGDSLRSQSFFENTRVYLPDTTEYRYEYRLFYELLRE